MALHPQCLVLTAKFLVWQIAQTCTPPPLASYNGLALASCAVHAACVGHALVARDLNKTARLGAYRASRLGRLAACLSLAIVYRQHAGAHIGCTRVLESAHCISLESKS
jgi:hypothetical protein